MDNKDFANLVRNCRETVEHRVQIEDSPFRLCTLYTPGETLPPHGPLRCPYLGKISHYKGKDVYSCYNGRDPEEEDFNQRVTKLWGMKE